MKLHRTPAKPFAAALMLLGTLTLLLVLNPQPPAPSAPQPVPSSPAAAWRSEAAIKPPAAPSAELPKGLAASEWSSIRQVYERNRRAAAVVGNERRARNHGQQWLTRFDGRGFAIEPDGAGWRWGLELQSYGFPGHERAVNGRALVGSDVERVTYDWDDGLQEWFVNEARGLEHGFTLKRRPAGAGEQLQLRLAVRGGLRPRVEADGRGVSFADEQDCAVINYTGLKVTDADGRELAAQFAAEDAALRLTVEAGGARYPITIDPLAQQAYLKASNTEAFDQFGFSVAVAGDTVVVGAPFENSNATGVNGNQADNSASQSGAVYVFVRSGMTWSQQAYLKASNTGAFDQFGISVAVSGDTVVVGADREDSNATGVNGNQADNSADDAGAAYVFVRSGVTWSQQAYLKASNTGAFDLFGYSVALSGDTVVVGAYLEDSNATGVNGNQADNSATEAGTAYAFVRSGVTWSQQAYLKASNTEAVDQFGISVAVAGNTVVVGALFEDSNATGVNGNQANNSAEDAGAAYVFVRSGVTWSQQAYLKASNTEAFDIFGESVAVAGDTAVVGAQQEDSNATGVNGNQADNSAGNSGAAYVFVRSGVTWSQQAYLKASNTEANKVGDLFGDSVAVSGDTVVVGADREDSNAMGVNGNQADNSADNSGAAYVFVRSGVTWSQQAYLKASNTDTGDLLGESVAVSGDTVVVGARLEAGNATGVNGNQADNSAADAGAVYVFLNSSSIVVNSLADSAPANDGQCTLREALLNANNNNQSGSMDCAAGQVGLDNITFNVGTGTPSIAVTGSPLPTITEPVMIDGATGGATRIELVGTSAGVLASGLTITAGNSTLRSLVINRFGSDGIELSTGGGNTIQNCLLGINAGGTAALGNNGRGVLISNAANNTIGGTTAGLRNVISGNQQEGVLLSGASTTNNQVLGNYIGTDVNGTAGLGNIIRGIAIGDASNNTIGGTAAGAGNLISGNGGGGILITNASATGNQIQGNFIGTNAAGTAALANTGFGILVQGAANLTTIGGTTASARNLISGNSQDGVLIFGATTTGAQVLGNFIGVNAAGTAALANGGAGVTVQNALNNTIGGTAAGAANTIAFNGARGVSLTGATATGNRMLTNTIFSNTNLGLDLNADGLTANDANDPDTGPNNLQNFPLLNSVTSTGTVSGSIDSTMGNSAYPLRLEFFGNTACDGSGNGEGEVFLGFTTVAAPGAFTAGVKLSPGKNFITATATDNNGNTSEFSACRQINTVPTITASAPLTRQQGSAAMNSQIATVGDPDQAPNTLTVQVNNAVAATVNGVTVSNLAVNVAGAVTADVVAGCTATNATFTLKVTDNVGEMNTATLTVNVTANTAPVLGTYPATGPINTGTGTTVTPNTPLTDNGSVASVTASASGFTGTLTGNMTTGVITVTNAGPAGNYTVTVTATDNCGTMTNTTFTLFVDTAPTISAVTNARAVGSTATNSQIATITDPDQALNTLTVQVNNAASATVNGVTVSNLSVTAGGAVNADISTTCAATTATFTLKVTDNLNLMNTATLTVNVTANTAPTLGTYPAATVAPGGGTTVTPSSMPADNGSVATLTASAPGFTGTLTGNTTTGVITVSNAGPAGNYTVTVTATDNCGATAMTTFTLGVGSQTITVTTPMDVVAADGLCSLREAIMAANTNAAVSGCNAGGPGLDNIAFNLGTGTPSIAVTGSALPAITEPVMIDGATGGATRVELNGTSAGTGANGLNLTAGNSTIRSLVVNRFTASGILIQTNGGNTVQNCFLGTNAAGTAAGPGNTNGGVLINAVTNNLIGGTVANLRNVVSGNGSVGVNIVGAGATGNQVLGNYIGIDAGGTAAIANNNHGVQIAGPNNTVGGVTAGAGNVISGNNGFGVSIGTTGNVVQGNFIGTNAASTAAIGNLGSGVFVGAANNTIGGTTALARNVVSGNVTGGISISGAAATGNQVQGNMIGLSADGLASFPNNNGVELTNSAGNNLIGGTTTTARNIISGNNNAGVAITNAATANQIQGNFIGINAAGAAFGNPGAGVAINLGSSGNTIGGTVAGAGNTIAFNGSGGLSGGVVMVNNTTINNRVSSNLIFSNVGLGIDLNNNGVTANDAGDADTGPNNLQNFPVINSVTSTGTISGSIDSTIANSAYPLRIEFFANATCDGSGNGEGEVLLGFVSQAAPGNFTFNFTPVMGKPFITATATDNNGNSSEFAACRLINIVPTITTGAPLTRQQGSAAINAQIATVGDPEQALNTLAVQVNNGTSATVTGVTVSNLAVNVAGVVTADVVANCTATNATFTLKVIDGVGEMSTATLTVNVTANTAPTLGTYPATGPINTGSGTTVTPSVAPTDNGSVATVTASAPGFTGSFSGNPTTGVITVSNAGPPGNYVVTVTATDNCGATTNTTFALSVGTAPTINAVTNSRATGSTATNAQIAGVTDPDQALNTLTVQVNNAASATVNGVTVSNLSVTAGGSVTADIATTCAATNATFTLKVTDNLAQMNTATLTVNVTANTVPTLGTYSATTVAVSGGTTVTPSGAPADNGSIATLTAAASPKPFTGMLSANPTTGVVTVSNAAPAGIYTVTVTATDNCGATATQTFTLGVGSQTITVTTTADTVVADSQCSLREAIIAANTNAVVDVCSAGGPGLDNIVFNIPGGGATPSIAVTGSALPTITEPLTIDGATGGATRVELNGAGAGAGADGLNITAGNSTIKSLVINRFSASGIRLDTGGGNTVQGNFIGTNAAGTAALPNSTLGIHVFAAANNTIGGTAAGTRNLISGNTETGIVLSDGSSGNSVSGNFIGTDVNGSLPLPNGSGGVRISVSPNNTVGGTTAAARNVISGNGLYGLAIDGGTATGNTVLGNFIGINVNGVALPNPKGIFISNALNNVIGGTANGARNVISGNTGIGVEISGATATGNQVLGNSIHSNGTLGIDLAGNGITQNDPGDGDAGPNGLQNFPLITAAMTTLTTTTFQGTLNSTPATTFRIEFFANPTCDPSGNGEGQLFIGFTEVTTAAAGTAPINITLPVAITPGHFVTATATSLDAGGNPVNTSEFSPCVCSFGFTPPARAFTAAGGSGTFGIITAPTCSWTVTIPLDSNFITINGASSGMGNGTISYTVQPQAGATLRSGTIDVRSPALPAPNQLVPVAPNQVIITQAGNTGVLIPDQDFVTQFPPRGWMNVDGGTGSGADAAWINPPMANAVACQPPAATGFPNANNFVFVNASTDSGCAAPNLQLDEQFITPPFNATGLGAVFVEFLSQYRAAPNSRGDVDVSTDGGLNWTTLLTLTADEGSNNNPVPRSVLLSPVIGLNAPNVLVRLRYRRNVPPPPAPQSPSGEQFAFWAVDFSIYGFGINPMSNSFTAAGGTGAVNVVADAGRPWMAACNVPWITNLTPTSGNGNGTVGYTVQPNTNPNGMGRTGTCAIAGNTFTVTQLGQACTPITINPAAPANGFVGAAYSQMLTATGGTPAYTFSVMSGALPTGLMLNGATGALTGTPTVAGVFNFTLGVSDNNTCPGSRSYIIAVSSASGLQFYPLPRPLRLVDTRANQGPCDSIATPITGGTSLTTLARVNCDGVLIPATAQAIVGNVTAINQTASFGFLTLFPTGQPLPLAANMIYEPGQLLSNNFTVGLNANGEFSTFAERTLHTVIDVSGYFAPPGAGGLFYHALPRPLRLLDTRADQSLCDNVGAPITGGTALTTQARITCQSITIPAAAQAIVGNATVINQTAQFGFMTLFSSGQTLPLAANMIYAPGQLLSNYFTVGLSAGGQFDTFAERTLHLVIDVAGYYSSEANDVNGPGLLFNPLPRPLRLLDTRAEQSLCDNVGAPIAAGTALPTQARLTCQGITIPAGAQTVNGNITVINTTAQFGFLTLFPAGQPLPLAANMIYAPGQLLSNAFVVGLSGLGAFNTFGERTIHVVIDVSGYFAP